MPLDAALDHKRLFSKHQRAGNNECAKHSQQQNLFHPDSPLIKDVRSRNTSILGGSLYLSRQSFPSSRTLSGSPLTDQLIFNVFVPYLALGRLG